MPTFTQRQKYEKWETRVEIVDVEPSEGVRDARKQLERIEDKMIEIKREQKKAWEEREKYVNLIENTYPDRCRDCGGTGKWRGKENACCVPDGWDPLHRNAWDFTKDERKEEAYLRGPFKMHPAFDLADEAEAKYHELGSQLSRLNREHGEWLDNQQWNETQQLKSLGVDIHRTPSPSHPHYIIKGHIVGFRNSFFL